MWAMAEAEGIAGLDTSVAHPARVYDYWLGGTDNFAADGEAAERVLAAAPGLRYRVRANRAFLGRATRYLAAEAALRQFLDIGTGIPAAGNTHEVAQRVAPDARVVYVDNDPIVLRHAQALLRSTPEGATAYLQADLRDPEAILDRAASLLDFGQPVAVMPLGVLHRHPPVPDERAAGLQRARRHPADLAHPGAGDPVLHRPRAGRPRAGAGPSVAARPGRLRRGGAVRAWRRGAQALAPGNLAVTWSAPARPAR
jgi:hypothetical protein